MIKNFKFTIGRKIYAILALCFVSFVAVTFYETREMGISLERQKQIELTQSWRTRPRYRERGIRCRREGRPFRR